MKLWPRFTLLVLLLVVAASADNRQHIQVDLSGFGEVPPVSSTGSGHFSADINDTTIDYTLTFSGLEGTSTTGSHIHFGTPGVNGGVMAFLCGGGDKPACPNPGGTVSGTIDAADIIGPAGQGIAAGEMAEAIRAMKNGHAYVNVHTDKHPGGEIRGDFKTAESGSN